MRVHARREQRERHVEQSSRSLAIALCLVSLAAVSCGKSQELRNTGPGPRGRGIGPVLTAAPLEAKPAEPSYVHIQDAPGPATEPAAPAPLEEPTLQPAAEDEAKAVRDFSAELTQMMGSPSDCLSARAAADAPSQLDIALSTRVMPSGTVTQSAVSAPGLAPSELACLRKRVETLHFAAPIENAPFGVLGTLHLTRAAAPAAPAAAQADSNAANSPGAPGAADTTTQL